jgi:hypothetical protein
MCGSAALEHQSSPALLLPPFPLEPPVRLQALLSVLCRASVLGSTCVQNSAARQHHTFSLFMWTHDDGQNLKVSAAYQVATVSWYVFSYASLSTYFANAVCHHDHTRRLFSLLFGDLEASFLALYIVSTTNHVLILLERCLQIRFGFHVCAHKQINTPDCNQG